MKEIMTITLFLIIGVIILFFLIVISSCIVISARSDVEWNRKSQEAKKKHNPTDQMMAENDCNGRCWDCCGQYDCFKEGE